MDETKSSDKISKVSLCGKQPKTYVDEGDILVILVLGIPCMMVFNIILIPSSNEQINVSRAI